MPITQFLQESFHAGILAGAITIAVLVFSPNTAHGQNWDLLDALLTQYVSPSEREGIRFNAVDYSALAQDPRYPRLLQEIAQVVPASLGSLQERLAFYINVYNVYAIKMVIDNSPLESIRDAGSLFSPVWKKPVGTINAEVVTLDQIEHGILRTMGEPRIHFAIVCSSLSCPNLRPEAYRAEKLEYQLEDQTRSFLADATKGASIDGNQVRVSQIFDWFEEDFEPFGGVEEFVRRYRELPRQVRLRANLPYIWNLNKVIRVSPWRHPARD